ncbi:unnamed protein product, partial [Cyprideis torosa]
MNSSAEPEPDKRPATTSILQLSSPYQPRRPLHGSGDERGVLTPLSQISHGYGSGKGHGSGGYGNGRHGGGGYGSRSHSGGGYGSRSHRGGGY